MTAEQLNIQPLGMTRDDAWAFMITDFQTKKLIGVCIAHCITDLGMQVVKTLLQVTKQELN